MKPAAKVNIWSIYFSKKQCCCIDGKCRAANKGQSADNERSKIGQNGRTICPVVYAGKEKI